MALVVVGLTPDQRGCWFLINKEALALVKAAMIMLNTYADLLGSAQLLEAAALIVGRETVEDLILELADTTAMSDPEIQQAKAELVLSQLRGTESLREKN